MRKIITGLYISLDGVVESPDQWQSPEQWQLDLGDSKMAEVEQTLTAETDTILLGQNTYQMWKDYWTTSELAFANHINNTKKCVITTTLDHAEWGDYDNIGLINDLETGIEQLKSQSGKNISVAGSVSLVQSLLRHDLLDKIILSVLPVVVGRGRRLFQESDAMKRFDLTNSAITSTGVTILTYQPKKG